MTDPQIQDKVKVGNIADNPVDQDMIMSRGVYVEQWLLSLPEKQRFVAEKFILSNWSLLRIRRKLRVSKQRVHTLLRQVRKKIRALGKPLRK